MIPAKTDQTQLGTIDGLRQTLEIHGVQFEALLPRHISISRFKLFVLSACKANQSLLRCSSFSFFSAVKTAAELGLEPNGALQHGWLIPYGQECKFIIGYKGMIDLAMRSGEVQDIYARLVYAGEEFAQEEGTEPRIVHRPSFEVNRADENIVAVYAIAKLRNGIVKQEVMAIQEVIDIQQGAASAKAGSSPWKSHYGEMVKKTAIRRLAKTLPFQSEIWSAAVKHDNADFEQEAAVTKTLPLRTQAPEPPLPAKPKMQFFKPAPAQQKEPEPEVREEREPGAEG